MQAQSSLFALFGEQFRRCSIETRSLPTVAHCFSRSYASPARTLLCLPRRSIREGGSLIPFAPFVEVAADLKRTTSAAVLKLDCLNQSSSQRPAKDSSIVSGLRYGEQRWAVLTFCTFPKLWDQRLVPE